MRKQTSVRSVTTGALAAAMAWAGTGTAAAAPPEDRGPERTATSYATAVLTGTETDMAVFFDVYAPEGDPAFGILEVFVDGYECLTEDRVAATVDGLESATAAGTLDLVCGSPDGEYAGTATVVDLRWIGEGEIERYTVAGRIFSCSGFGEQRRADVTGSVTVEIPGLGIDESTAADDTYSRLTYVEGICPPGRN